MRLFLDTGDVEAIRRANDTGLLDGVTTNPTHIAKTGRTFHEVIKEICNIVSGPVSVEAMGETAEELIREAERASEMAPNIAVKIPMTVAGLRAVPLLEDKGISCNVT
ncbi:MAG: fructose-6-phosphate aldolase, partial [Planctomycetes bacterium]|nr:fructose-6-phosphate aldolase [Planctomycetota bacterium]